MNDKKWFEDVYRRNLVDMHIEDWNDEFLSKYDPEKYIEMLKLSKVKAAMIYANSHVGYCYWPTKIGQMHKGIKGKDIFGEMISLCHKNDIVPLAYYTVIFDNWAYEKDPKWRIIDIDGKPSREWKSLKEYGGETEHIFKHERWGLCCPNSEGYREYTVAQLKDLVSTYDFKGIFIDMDFWPGICYCDSCRKRYSKEVGKDIPETIDWDDHNWITFQKKREEWINDFANLITDTVKSIKPDVMLEHQSAVAPRSWIVGRDGKIAGEYSDYTGGDFYGGFSQQSFACKFFYNLTKNKPFDFMTFTADSNPNEETTLKTTDMLKLHNYITLAHSGAFFFINAIKPDGSLDKRSFKRMGEVYGESILYEEYLGGDLVEDVAVYFSFASKMNLLEKGRARVDWFYSRENHPHLKAILGASKILQENHIPFGVITRKDLDKLSNYKVLVLSDVFFIDEEELEKISNFVKNGGYLYASGMVSDKLLNNIFQLEYLGRTKEKITYMSPVGKGLDLIDDIDKDNPLAIRGSQVLVKSKESGYVLAKLVLPYTDPQDAKKFASIHSNPPGIKTDYDSIIYQKVGSGKALYITYPIEGIDKAPHKNTFSNMIKELSSTEFSFSSDAPHTVEITSFSQEKNKRIILNVVNIQDKLPALPVRQTYTFAIFKCPCVRIQ